MNEACKYLFRIYYAQISFTAVGLLLGWLLFQKTKAGNARKCYASSPTILVVLKRLTNEVIYAQMGFLGFD